MYKDQLTGAVKYVK